MSGATKEEGQAMMTEEREKELRVVVTVDLTGLTCKESLECLDAIAEMRREIKEQRYKTVFLMVDVLQLAYYFDIKGYEVEAKWLRDRAKDGVMPFATLKAENERLRAVVDAVTAVTTNSEWLGALKKNPFAGGVRIVNAETYSALIAAWKAALDAEEK